MVSSEYLQDRFLFLVRHSLFDIPCFCLCLLNLNFFALRLIKLAILSFVLIFILITVMSLFIPSHIRISKAINLSTTNTRVFSMINDTAQWKTWHPWFKASPELISHIQVDWKVKTDSISTVQLAQTGKKTLLNSWQLHRYPSTDSVTLQWYMDFYPKWYPWEKFGTLFYETNYGTVMEKGLNNIKTIVQ